MALTKGERVRHPKREDWGLGEVLADSDGDIVSVLFENAGEKKISLKYVQLDEISDADATSSVLDEIVSEATGKYKIGRPPSLRASRNKRTWGIIEQKLSSGGSAAYEQLVIWCKPHDHASGGRGFVDYCIRHGWLVPATDKAPEHTGRSSHGKVRIAQTGARSLTNECGIYMVRLLTEELMPVTRDPRYVETCARVNNKHVKIGKARNFEKRRSDYWGDFDAHNVEFVPLARLNEIQAAETAILRHLRRFRMLSPKGGKLEWLLGVEPKDAVQKTYQVLDTHNFEYKVITNRFI